jgi:hypothetical protein
MTNDRFRELCEQVLLPRLGDFTFQQLTDLYGTLDDISEETSRIGRCVDWIAARLSEHDQHGGDG